MDIKEEFKREYEKEKSIEEIEEKIKRKFSSMLDDEDEAPSFWCILADMEWRYGVLTEQTKNKTLEILENGGDVEFWRETSDEKEAQRRKNVLKKLEEKLKTPQPKKRKIIKREPFICNWEKGDVFAYKMDQKYMEGTEYYNKYLMLIMWETVNGLNDNIIPIVYVVNKIYDSIPNIEMIKKENLIKFFEMEKNKYVYKVELSYDLVRERKKLEEQKRIGKIENFKNPTNEHVDKYFEINNTELCFYDRLSDLVIYTKYNIDLLLNFIENKKQKKKNK